MPAPRINPALLSAATRANLAKVQAQLSLGNGNKHNVDDNQNSARESSLKNSELQEESAKIKWERCPKAPKGEGKIPRGAKFGMLEVIDIGRNVNKQKMSLCKCACGSYTIVANSHLLSGHTTSCGCKNIGVDKEKLRRLKEKFSHPLYKAWTSMKHRCDNPNAQQYHNYGARGISVCDEWRTSYNAFREWALSNGWKKGLSLDRIDNDGNYCPRNCRWTDKPTQGRNRRTNILVTYKGETKTVAEWAEITGLYYTTILERVRHGWSPEDIIEKPKRAYNRGGKKGDRKYAKFSLFINPLILSTGQQKKMNFVTKTIFVDSRVENGMRLVEEAAKQHTDEIHRVCPPGTRIALTIIFLCPYPTGTKESERIERGLMGEGFDCDNKYKAIGDAFTNAGWWPDDRYVTSLMIEKRRTTAMPRIEIIIEPDKIREPSLLSDEEMFDDEPIATDADIDEDDDFSLFSAMGTREESATEEHDSPSLFNNGQTPAKPEETNPLSELMSSTTTISRS